MDQLRSEFYETISNLNRKFNKKIKEHMNRIERQQDQLNHQNGIIEELAWQIRDLRDSLRKCNEQISWPQSKYCVGCAKNRMKLNIPTANGTAHTIDHVPGMANGEKKLLFLLLLFRYFSDAPHECNCVQLRMNVAWFRLFV